MAGADRLPLPDGVATTLLVQGTTITRIQGRLEQTLLSDGSASQRLRGAFPAGVSADAIDAELSILSGHVSTATGNMGSAGQHVWDVGAALETCESTVEGLQTEWDELDQWFDGALADINADPYYALAENQRDRAEAIESIDLQRESGRDDLRERYHTAIDTFGDAASTAASRLTELTDGFVPASQQGSATDIAAAMTAGTTVADGERQQHVAEEEAEDAGELLEQAENGDEEAMQEFIDTYGDLVDNPYFAVALNQELGAEGLTDLSAQVHDMLNPENAVGGNYEFPPGQEELLTSLAETLGTAYVTAIGPLDDMGFPPNVRTDVSNWRNEWYTDLMEQGERHHPGTHGEGVYGYELQMQLLGAGLNAEPDAEISREYMNSVGRDVVAWDRQMTIDHPNRTNFSITGLDQAYDVPLTGSGDINSLDPLHSLLRAAERNPEAAYGLLNGSIPAGEGESDNDEYAQSQSVLEYLIENRSTQEVDPYPHTGGLYAMADQGELLGSILEQYGTDTTDRDSSVLAQNAVESSIDALSSSGQPTNGFGQEQHGSSIAGSQLAGLRPGMGSVVAAHIDSFHFAGAHPGTGTDDALQMSADGTWGMTFTGETVDEWNHLFEELGRDRPGDVSLDQPSGGDYDAPALQRVINASFLEQYGAMSESLGADGQPDIVGATDAIEWGAGFDAYVLDSLGAGQEDEASGYDEYNQYMQDLSNEVAGLVPVGKIPVVGGAVDQVVDWGKDPLLDAIWSTDHQAAQQAENLSWQESQDNARDALIYSVIAETGNYEGAAQLPSEWGGHVPPSGQFWDADGNILPYHEMTTEQQGRFHEWVVDRDGAGNLYGDIHGDAQAAAEQGRTEFGRNDGSGG